MFPDWTQARKRLAELASRRPFQLVVAAFLACMHLAMFARAGHDRLGLPFNSAPGEAPFFSNPDAPSTRGFPRQPHHWSRLIVSRFDAQHYIGTSIRDVTACPDNPAVDDVAYLDCGLGWLPAYGTIAGGVTEVTGLADDVTLVILSVISAIVLNL